MGEPSVWSINAYWEILSSLLLIIIPKISKYCFVKIARIKRHFRMSIIVGNLGWFPIFPLSIISESLHSKSLVLLNKWLGIFWLVAQKEFVQSAKMLLIHVLYTINRNKQEYQTIEHPPILYNSLQFAFYITWLIEIKKKKHYFSGRKIDVLYYLKFDILS